MKFLERFKKIEPVAPFKPEFTRNEILVIKACKNHFNKFHGYGDALRIIQHVIYGNSKPYFENEFKVLREILLKSRNWTAKQWADFEGEAFLKARETTNFFRTGKFLVEDVKDLEYNLINIYCGKIQHILVMEKLPSDGYGHDAGYEEIFSLDITPEEQAEVDKALDNSLG